MHASDSFAVSAMSFPSRQSNVSDGNGAESNQHLGSMCPPTASPAVIASHLTVPPASASTVQPASSSTSSRHGSVPSEPSTTNHWTSTMPYSSSSPSPASVPSLLFTTSAASFPVGNGGLPAQLQTPRPSPSMGLISAVPGSIQHHFTDQHPTAQSLSQSQSQSQSQHVDLLTLKTQHSAEVAQLTNRLAQAASELATCHMRILDLTNQLADRDRKLQQMDDLMQRKVQVPNNDGAAAAQHANPANENHSNGRSTSHSISHPPAPIESLAAFPQSTPPAPHHHHHHPNSTPPAVWHGPLSPTEEPTRLAQSQQNPTRTSTCVPLESSARTTTPSESRDLKRPIAVVNVDGADGSEHVSTGSLPIVNGSSKKQRLETVTSSPFQQLSHQPLPQVSVKPSASSPTIALQPTTSHQPSFTPTSKALKAIMMTPSTSASSSPVPPTHPATSDRFPAPRPTPFTYPPTILSLLAPALHPHLRYSPTDGSLAIDMPARVLSHAPMASIGLLASSSSSFSSADLSDADTQLVTSLIVRQRAPAAENPRAAGLVRARLVACIVRARGAPVSAEKLVRVGCGAKSTAQATVKALVELATAPLVVVRQVPAGSASVQVRRRLAAKVAGGTAPFGCKVVELAGVVMSGLDEGQDVDEVGKREYRLERKYALVVGSVDRGVLEKSLVRPLSRVMEGVAERVEDLAWEWQDEDMDMDDAMGQAGDVAQ